MFFPDRIKNILPTDKVLEIGPGSNPHPRSDIYLEKIFKDDSEYFEQRGKTSKIIFQKPVYYYNNDYFPFKDNEFDYVICSHVLEHVEKLDVFVSEMCRVASKGYIEYPTIYYDYIYNIPVHTTLLFYEDGILHWMLKKQIPIDLFQPVQFFFYKTLENHYYNFIDSFQNYFFQGFEWEEKISTLLTNKITDLCYHNNIVIVPKLDNPIDSEIIENDLTISKCTKTLFKLILNLFK